MSARVQAEPEQIVKTKTKDRMKYFWIGAICLLIGAVGSGLTVYNANAARDAATAELIEEARQKDKITDAFIHLLERVDEACDTEEGANFHRFGFCDVADEALNDPTTIPDQVPPVITD